MSVRFRMGGGDGHRLPPGFRFRPTDEELLTHYLAPKADDAGFAQATKALRQSLAEEEAMAAWIDQSLPDVTRRYASLYAEAGSSEAKI